MSTVQLEEYFVENDFRYSAPFEVDGNGWSAFIFFVKMYPFLGAESLCRLNRERERERESSKTYESVRRDK